jgi:hypothetical protein
VNICLPNGKPCPTTDLSASDSLPDSGIGDTGDIASADAGTADVGTADAGTADVGTADVGMADVGMADKPHSGCGNGKVEAGETCDGDCPTACNDGNACTVDRLTGSAKTCSASCSFQPISACQGGDGCCPVGCNAITDSDCSPSCGNGIVESGETCDGDCPTACNDGNACTVDSLTGSANNCSAELQLSADHGLPKW